MSQMRVADLSCFAHASAVSACAVSLAVCPFCRLTTLFPFVFSHPTVIHYLPILIVEPFAFEFPMLAMVPIPCTHSATNSDAPNRSCQIRCQQMPPTTATFITFFVNLNFTFVDSFFTFVLFCFDCAHLWFVWEYVLERERT